MIDIKIQDNFLPEKLFQPIQNFFMKDCTWRYHPYVNGAGEDSDENAFQFVHIFWLPNRGIVSANIKVIDSLLQMINPNVILRIKANLNVKTPEKQVRDWHTDVGPYGHITSIYYPNTNNGATHFENGKKIGSIANRLVTFPSNMKHSGSTCTDEKTRVVLNINYLKET